jgi:hypothetical protein
MVFIPVVQQVLKFAEHAQDVVIQRAKIARFNSDDFRENVGVPADDIAPASDFPITVDLRFPLFASSGTRKSLFPSTFLVLDR